VNDSEVIKAVERTAEHVRQMCGFGENLRLADELVRLAANTNLAPRLFAAWLRRTPEALAYFMDELDKLAVLDGAPSLPRGPEFDTRPTSIPVTHADFATQSSEPKRTAGRDFGSSSHHGEPGSGRKGAKSEPLVVNIGNAAAVLGTKTLQTRPVTPGDVMELGDVPAIRGQQAVKREDGTTLKARAWFRDKIRFVEFLDKRGPLLMMRVADGPERGNVVTGSITFIDPTKRAEVLAALGDVPGSDDEFNFNPYEGQPDPWTGHVSPSTEPDSAGVPFATTIEQDVPQAAEFPPAAEIPLPIKAELPTVPDGPPDGDYEPRDHG